MSTNVFSADTREGKDSKGGDHFIEDQKPPNWPTFDTYVPEIINQTEFYMILIISSDKLFIALHSFIRIGLYFKKCRMPR